MPFFRRVSTRWVLPTWEVWLANTATDAPWRRGRYWLIWSAPVRIWGAGCWPRTAVRVSDNRRISDTGRIVQILVLQDCHNLSDYPLFDPLLFKFLVLPCKIFF